MDDLKSVSLTVEGMTCSNCALSIAKHLQQQAYTDIHVDFASGMVEAKVPTSVSIENISAGITKLGYRVVNQQSQQDKPTFWQKVLSLDTLFIIAASLTLPLILGMFFPHLPFAKPIVQLFLCLPVWVGGWLYFGKSSLSSIRMGVPNMNVLVLLGSSAAFLYSLLLLQQGQQHLYFETAAAIITLVLLGNFLEKKAIHQTTSALSDLVLLQNTPAKRINIVAGQEHITTVNANLLGVGEQILVNVGDRIPTDGIVYWGEGSSDESTISGESIPIDKKIGNQLIAGTLVATGSLKYRSTAVGSHTTLAQIIDMVRRAQTDQAPIQRLADRISAVFVPIVILLAALTLAGNWYWNMPLSVAILRTIAVVVVACPCAMGLATPTAMIVSIGRAAKNGILIKGANTIEHLAQIRFALFDKTGTLTDGRFTLHHTQLHNHLDQPTVWSLVYGLEQYSSHPIALSLNRHFAQQNISPHYFVHIEEQKAMGMTGKDHEGNEYALVSQQTAQNIAHLPTDSQHDNLFLFKNSQLVASFQLGDSIKAEAAETIDQLKQQGITSVLVSGDTADKCALVAQQIGITEVFATQKPEQKMALVQQFAQKNVTLMVGDGINDAPAMAKAQVSMSLSDATQVAVQSAKVVLLQDKLPLIAQVVTLSRRTMRVVRQNLFWAFFYNVLMLPLAATGRLDPMMAAAAMSLSSIIVVLNSLRLR